jgi:hypothetical protein
MKPGSKAPVRAARAGFRAQKVNPSKRSPRGKRGVRHGAENNGTIDGFHNVRIDSASLGPLPASLMTNKKI